MLFSNLKKSIEQSFTWPQLQQVVQDFNVLFEVQSAGQLLRVDEDPVGMGGRLLALAEQHRAETHGQVLTRHLVDFLVGCDKLQVVKKLLQCHLVYTHINKCANIGK